MKTLTDDIIFFQEKGKVILNGDLNAKTGNLDDNIQPDKYDKNFYIKSGTNSPKRNSEDKAVNERGKNLIEKYASPSTWIF